MRLFHATFSLVALAAWLVASNHCAIGSFMPAQAEAAATAHQHCASEQPAAPTDSEKDPSCDGSKCCKSLSAPTIAFAKNPVQFDTLSWTDAPLFAAIAAPAGEDHHLPISEFDTGPPERPSFAESVLQRSILAHAPPLVA
jgi:hypothetical protein